MDNIFYVIHHRTSQRYVTAIEGVRSVCIGAGKPNMALRFSTEAKALRAILQYLISVQENLVRTYPSDFEVIKVTEHAAPTYETESVFP